MLIMGIEGVQRPIVQGCLLLLLLVQALALALALVGEDVVAEKAAKVAEASHVCKVLALFVSVCGGCAWRVVKVWVFVRTREKIRYKQRKIGARYETWSWRGRGGVSFWAWV